MTRSRDKGRRLLQRHPSRQGGGVRLARHLPEPARMIPTRLRVPAFLLLLPLGLALLPALQLYRVHVSRGEAQVLRARIERAQVEGEDAPGTDARVAQRRARDLEKERVLTASLERLPERELLAWVGALSALGAFATGAGAILQLRVGRRRAKASIEALHVALDTGWRRISLLLVVHVALMLLAMLAMGFYELSWTVSHRSEVGWIPIAFVLMLGSGIAAGARLLFSAARALAPLPPLAVEVQGRVMTRELAPGVWRWVQRIATSIRAPMPDQLVIGIAEGFFVTSAPVFLPPRGDLLTGRTLYLPLTYLSVLSQEEASSIIGHELGHFAARDTDHGAQLAVAYRRVQQGVDRLEEHQDESPSVFNLPSLWTLQAHAHALDEAFFHFSRGQELRADTLGARATSAEAAASALLRVTALSQHVDAALEDAQRGSGRNAVTSLLESLEASPLGFSDDLLGQALAHPVDAHPPTRARLEALSVPLSDGLIAHALRPPTSSDTSWFQALLSTPAAVA